MSVPRRIGVLNQVLADAGPGVRAVFVSIDPERDDVGGDGGLPPVPARCVHRPTRARRCGRPERDAVGREVREGSTRGPGRYGMAHTADVFLVDAGAAAGEVPVRDGGRADRRRHWAASLSDAPPRRARAGTPSRRRLPSRPPSRRGAGRGPARDGRVHERLGRRREPGHRHPRRGRRARHSTGRSRCGRSSSARRRARRAAGQRRRDPAGGRDAGLVRRDRRRPGAGSWRLDLVTADGRAGA